MSLVEKEPDEDRPMSSELSANLVALNTIVYPRVRRFTRIWPQTLPPAITMVLHFVIFGNLIGRQIGDMGGFTYMEYIVPGLIMMSVITNATTATWCRASSAASSSARWRSCWCRRYRRTPSSSSATPSAAYCAAWRWG